MQQGVTLGIIAVLVMLLQGCGHKGPLGLPAPDATPRQGAQP
jgi:predicted small lipoprotein YifL